MIDNSFLQKIVLVVVAMLLFNATNAQKITFVGDTNRCDTMHVTYTEKYGTLNLRHTGCRVLNIKGLFQNIDEPEKVKIEIISSKGNKIRKKFIVLQNKEISIFFPKLEEDFYSIFLKKGSATLDRVKLLFD